jgi:hypothetical protein
MPGQLRPQNSDSEASSRTAFSEIEALGICLICDAGGRTLFDTGAIAFVLVAKNVMRSLA